MSKHTDLKTHNPQATKPPISIFLSIPALIGFEAGFVSVFVADWTSGERLVVGGISHILAQ